MFIGRDKEIEHLRMENPADLQNTGCRITIFVSI